MPTSKLTKLCLPLAFVMAAQVPLPASAGIGTASISVGSNVLALCLVGGSSIAFGNYTGSQVDQSGSVTTLCTFGTSYNVSLDAGTGTGATTTTRKMTGVAGDTLSYKLYRDSARTQSWGNNIGTDTLAQTGTGLFQSIPIYGRVTSGQAPRADAYSDTVTITLTY